MVEVAHGAGDEDDNQADPQIKRQRSQRAGQVEALGAVPATHEGIIGEAQQPCSEERNKQQRRYVFENLQKTVDVVNLYGWIDELCKDVVKDIKTTKRYEFGNYAHYWQRHVYPYCLIESGDSKAIKGFEFTVVKWTGGTKSNPLLSGEMYKEFYTYDHCESSALIRQECERFVEWLEQNRDKITNKKIFNEQ